MLLAEKKMEEIEGNMKGWDMLGPLPERAMLKAMLNAILWGFHWGRNYSGGMWDIRNPSNKKVAATTTQPAQKQDKTWKKQSQPNASCWKEDGRNRGKHERLGTLPRESQVECHSMGFPQRRKHSKGSGDVRNPSSKKHDKTCDNQALLTLFSPYHARPSDAIGSSLEVMKRTWTK